MGDSVLTRTSSSICELCIMRQRAVEPDRGVVDEAEQRTEFLAQRPHQIGNFVDLAEVEGTKCSEPRLARLASALAAVRSLVFLSRHRDDAIARSRELARDAEAQAAAARR